MKTKSPVFYNWFISYFNQSLFFLFIVFGISACNQAPSIHIATKPMTEQHIIGEMLKALIEQETKINVKITHGVGGGTSNIHPALIKGDFDIYPEYTGTAWNAVLKNADVYQENLFAALQAQYSKQFQLEWVGMFGFNNTYGLAVRKELAEQYQLRTYSDLAAVAGQLVFGAEYDFFERQDGFPALSKAYGLVFKKNIDMDIGLKYRAIKQGQIDAMNIFTTDGQLTSADLTVLTDNQQLYPSYRCGIVIRAETLRQHPTLRGVLEKFSGVLDDTSMAQLNYRVEIEKQDPKIVAVHFLREKNLII